MCEDRLHISGVGGATSILSTRIFTREKMEAQKILSYLASQEMDEPGQGLIYLWFLQTISSHSVLRIHLLLSELKSAGGLKFHDFLLCEQH